MQERLFPRREEGKILGYELILWGILFLIMASISVTINSMSLKSRSACSQDEKRVKSLAMSLFYGVSCSCSWRLSLLQFNESLYKPSHGSCFVSRCRAT